MMRNYKFHTIILITLILPALTIGCQKKDVSIPGDYSITCYAASYAKGIYRSGNGGTSWFPLEFDQEDLYFYFKRLYLSQGRDALYVTTAGAGLFTINLETGLFANVNQFKDGNTRSMAFRSASHDKNNNVEILIGMDSGGVFKAQYGSENWQAFNKGLTFYDVNVLFTHGQDLFAGTAKSLFKWDEASKRWSSTAEGIKNKNIFSIGADSQGKILY
ncbi:hypothetical protein ACFL0H_15170, partial [Thermodesulfobacteriota bacterium]